MIERTAVPTVEVLERLRVTSPMAAALATLASIAARVDRLVLRTLRIELLSEADATAEADLWCSDIVARRSTNEIVLRTDVLPALRADLARSTNLGRARALIRTTHAGGSSLLELEEDLIWLGMSGHVTRVEIEGRLGEAIAVIREHKGRAPDIAGWALAALPRLPNAVRNTGAAWSLAFAAETESGYAIELDGAPPADGLVLDASVPSIPLGLVREGDDLLLGAVGGAPISVPATTPRVVTVEGGAETAVVKIDPGSVRRVPFGQKRELVLTNLLGERWQVKPAESGAPAPDEFRGENGRWILVHGSEGLELPPHHYALAQSLGEALAQEGFSLVTLGRTGVSHVVASTFVTILEKQGYSSCIYRLLHIVREGEKPDFPGRGRVLPPPAKTSVVAGGLSRAAAALSIGESELSTEIAAAAKNLTVPFASAFDLETDSWVAAVPPDNGRVEAAREFAMAIVASLRTRLQVDADQPPPALAALFHEAALALDQQDLGRYNQRLPSIRERARSLVSQKEAEGLIVDALRPSHRLVGYYKPENMVGPAILTVALGVERRTVQDLWETRTLWLALKALLGGWVGDAGLARALAAVLASIGIELDSDRRIDPQNSCRKLLSQVVPTKESAARASELADLAVSYNRLRSTLPAGAQRTREMAKLVDEIEKRFGGPGNVREAGIWFTSGMAGQRIVALGLLLADPDAAGYWIAEDAIVGSHSAFEQYTALRVARQLLVGLDATNRDRLAKALEMQRSGPPGQITESNSGRWSLSGELLRQLRPQDIHLSPLRAPRSDEERSRPSPDEFAEKPADSEE